ncbi:hypothetical protein BD626DRAFT_19179 [Schizophyllum amplum]|uniref:Glycopeptide n=1 Tax=Schizophyllum amplum TaxID=97359 RepID=A0A550CYG2_9AGAR|nr:hypothetical protein BD626DRAFT_19179 [Auriculariopsis ampla]
MLSATLCPTLALAMVLGLQSLGALAETHIIKFDNQCGYGTPTLLQGGISLTLDSNEYTSDGEFSAAIAYLQTGDCKYNGEGCMTTEITLVNPSSAGSGSSVDLSLIPPLAFNVPTTFSYYGGCDGDGKTCDSSGCGVNAFFVSTDWHAQVQCQSDDVNLLITFCGDGSGASPSASSFSTTSSSSMQASSATSSSVVTSPTTSASPALNAVESGKSTSACPNRVRRRAERRQKRHERGLSGHKRSGHSQ